MHGGFKSADGRAVPAVTAAEMREVDRVAVEEVGLPLLSMMENAGRNLAGVVRSMLAEYDSGERDGPVTVVAGGGGNGGGGLACARHLANRGVEVRVVLDRVPDELAGAPATQFAVLDAMRVPVVPVGAASADVADATLVVDALIGYGLRSAPRGRAVDLIDAMGRAGVVLALDVPSGVNATSGETPGVAVDPSVTLTLALPKTGLSAVQGDLLLADIGIPAAVFERAGIEYSSPFASDGGEPAYWVALDIAEM